MTHNDGTLGAYLHDRQIPGVPCHNRHDTDGQVYLAYFRKDANLGFVWDGNIEHPIQVTHEMGEAVIDTFELGGPLGGYIMPSVALFEVFKEHCDHYADTHEGDNA